MPAVVLVLCAACGGESGGDVQQPRRTPVPTTVSLPPEKPAAPSRELTVTGTVEQGVEAGCIVLRTASGTTYQLSGPLVSGLALDREATVRGSIDTAVATTCQQGPLLRVRAID